VVQNWVKILILISLDKMLKGSGSDNLTKVIVEALTIGGGLPRNLIAQKFIFFGANGINVFYGTKSGVTKQIHDICTLPFIKVHCMAHCINLVVQTLMKLPLVVWIVGLL
jgi:hypothetical protein